jgi:Na+-transporting NADH:ubiquinone oxidoreductase subunit B
MKGLKKFIHKFEKHFVDGGKLAKFFPVYEMAESILFSPKTVTKKGPHVRDSVDLKRYMILVVMALGPIALFSIYNTGVQAMIASGLTPNLTQAFIKGLWIVLPIIIVSYSVGGFWEVLFAVVRKHEVNEGFLVTGILFALILPPTIPLWQVAMGISFGIVIGKEIFGGVGRNFLNPALTGRAFLFFAYPAQMSGDGVWAAILAAKEKIADVVTTATPLAMSTLVEAPNKIETVLSANGYSLSKLFMGNYLGSIGETSTILIILGAVFLISVGVASYRVIFGGVVGVLVMGIVLNLLGGPSANPWYSLAPVYHLLLGGFAFGIVFMATDPVSAPSMDVSKWIYGFLIGVLVVLIRVFNPAYPEGTMLAILFMNVFAPLVDYFVVRSRLKKRIKNVG